MSWGLFKKNQSPSPPKNQIEVVCPACGAAQYEPRLVVSTFCKGCGVHLSIVKKRVVASEVSKSGGGQNSAMLPTRAPAVAPAPVSGVVPGPRASSGPITPGRAFGAPSRTAVPSKAGPPPAAPALPDISETGELGLGMMLQAASYAAKRGHVLEDLAPAAEAEPVPAEEAPPEPVVDEPVAQPEVREADEPAKGPIPVATMMRQAPANLAAASPVGTLQKMKDQGFYRQQYFKEAQCFECDHKFKVGRSSRSANCPGCGAYISLEDIELNMPSTQAIKTRGDVLIRKRGQLSATHLFAKDLRCQGSVSANINCSGDAIFRTTGTIVGEVRCRRFIVEKGSAITFMNPIHADEVEINAPITGNVFSKGPVLISANGAVNGDVTARSVSIEPGGELNGAMNIVRSTPSK